MGLLKSIVELPLAPARGVVSLAGVLEDQARRERTDPGVIRRQLEEIDGAWEAGEITDEERDELEDELLALLQQG